ncbi:hypothetical protein Fcan01_28396 [Folsomia candida]|uniref:Uncharacterized protein n=1 Tax=Folsomia candida TaxID=158441 RepID=A0A226CWE4_FOLCA|nr:hypothetical protein Fcan01_28396 [Folsomia candida]
MENLNLVCPAKCHPLQLETPERARFTPLGHSYKSETKHFCDNFKGIRENSEIPKLHEKGKPKSCMSCQMPPVTVRDSGKGALYAPRNPRKLRIPKLHEKGKPKSCMSCQMPPVTARDSGKGALYAPRENLNLVCPAKCHPLQLETPERARFTPLGHGYKRIKTTFAITLKESEKTPKYRKLHEKGKPKSCHATNDKTTFAITLKESEKTPKYRNYMKRENLNLVCAAKCHPLQLETPERARCTPLGVDLKVYNQL